MDESIDSDVVIMTSVAQVWKQHFKYTIMLSVQYDVVHSMQSGKIQQI